MHRGYIKLWRKSLDSGLLKNSNLWTFWCWCLLKASHKEIKIMVGYQEVVLQPGDFVFGRKKAAKELKMSERTVRTCLKTLKNILNVTIKTTNKFSIVSVMNWESYQSDNSASDHQSDQQATNKRPTSDQQATTNKNVKNNKNVKEQQYTPSDDEGDFYITKKKRKLNGKRYETFKMFWAAFNYRKGKAAAADSWIDIPTLTDSLMCDIINAAEMEAAQRPRLKKQGRTPKWAQGWITDRRWEDEIESTEPTRIYDE